MKIGTKLRVTATPEDENGNPALVDGDAVQIQADNGAQVAPIDGFTAIVILTQAGKTTISATPTVGGEPIECNPLVESVQGNAARVLLSATVEESAAA